MIKKYSQVYCDNEGCAKEISPLKNSTLKFITESNMIEGIERAPTKAEIAEHDRFINLGRVTPEELKRFVSVYQPDALLRDEKGIDVQVGGRLCPPGGFNITQELYDLLYKINSYTPYELHRRYEHLHPFTDCNGRSGRALWAWKMLNSGQSISLGFLHHFYYQALAYRG